VWRPEDAALLERLENEALIRSLWTHLTGDDAHPPHPRAAGMLHLLRQTAEGETAAQEALAGSFTALSALTRPDSYAGLGAPLRHHLALFYARVARALDPDSAAAHESEVRTAAAWLSLRGEPYLRELAEAVASDAMKVTEREAIADAAPTRPLERLGHVGREGAETQTRRARLALRVLRSHEHIVALAGVDEVTAKRASRLAERLRDRVLDAALRKVDVALEDARARAEPGEEHLQLFAEAARIWRWADEDPFVERFAIQRALPISWELYNAKKWPLLRVLNAHLAPMVDRLAQRVESDPAELPYAAPTAQMLVFRAELEYRFERQLAHAERAVRICDTHRNGRLVYADLLAERAIRTLERAPVFGRGPARDKAKSDVLEARRLWPSIPRLKQAEDALRREGIALP